MKFCPGGESSHAECHCFPSAGLGLFSGISGERLAGALRSAWPWGGRGHPNVFGVREVARKSPPTCPLKQLFQLKIKDIMMSFIDLVLKS